MCLPSWWKFLVQGADSNLHSWGFWTLIGAPDRAVISSAHLCHLKNWVGLLMDVKTKDTIKAKNGRRKDLLLVVHGIFSQGSICPNSTIGEVFFFFFSGPRLWHMEIPRQGVESELQPLAYTAATATRDPSHICDQHHSSWQHGIPNPPIDARDRTCILMDPSQVP